MTRSFYTSVCTNENELSVLHTRVFGIFDASSCCAVCIALRPCVRGANTGLWRFASNGAQFDFRQLLLPAFSLWSVIDCCTLSRVIQNFMVTLSFTLVSCFLIGIKTSCYNHTQALPTFTHKNTATSSCQQFITSIPWPLCIWWTDNRTQLYTRTDTISANTVHPHFNKSCDAARTAVDTSMMCAERARQQTTP